MPFFPFSWLSALARISRALWKIKDGSSGYLFWQSLIVAPWLVWELLRRLFLCVYRWIMKKWLRVVHVVLGSFISGIVPFLCFPATMNWTSFLHQTHWHDDSARESASCGQKPWNCAIQIKPRFQVISVAYCVSETGKLTLPVSLS